MVTKQTRGYIGFYDGSVLAKIHMVTKHLYYCMQESLCSVLAKIHMVTKHAPISLTATSSSVLAKIHMVTKLPVSPFL